jgi:ParB/RepB/Spo0J family partition protein
MLIPLENITPNPWQTRQADNQDYIEALAKDISVNSLLQVPLGRLIDAEGNFCKFNLPINQAFIDGMLTLKGCQVQLAFGHNRLAAYRLLAEKDSGKDEKAGYDLMPVDVRNLTDEQTADYAWSENEKRREHTPVERARAIQKRIEDFGWSQAQTAEHLGISRPAVSNALRLLRLPENILKKLSEGDVSERVAMALVSLFDLPDQLRAQSEQSYGDRPSEIIRKALEGQLTSDSIRGSVTEICQRFGEDLNQAPFKVSDVFDLHNVESKTCQDCSDYRLKERNICIVRSCFEAKKQVAISNYLQQASQICGISPLEYGKGSYDVTEFTWRDRKRFAIVKSSGCENLRLMYSPNQKGKDDQCQDQRVEGFPHALIVCGKREQFCNCLKGLKATEDVVIVTGSYYGGNYERTVKPSSHQIEGAQPTAEELKKLARAARQEKREANQEAKAIVQEVAERIAVGLSMKNRDTWLEMGKSVHYSVTGDNLWDIQVAIGRHMAQTNMPYEINHFEEVIIRMNTLLKECSLAPLDAPPEDQVLEQQARVVAEADEPEFQGKPLVEVLQEQTA